MKMSYIIFAMLGTSVVFSQEYLESQPENPEPGDYDGEEIVQVEKNKFRPRSHQ